jgi:hypothetical protein
MAGAAARPRARGSRGRRGWALRRSFEREDAQPSGGGQQGDSARSCVARAAPGRERSLVGGAVHEEFPQDERALHRAGSSDARRRRDGTGAPRLSRRRQYSARRSLSRAGQEGRCVATSAAAGERLDRRELRPCLHVQPRHRDDSDGRSLRALPIPAAEEECPAGPRLHRQGTQSLQGVGATTRRMARTTRRSRRGWCSPSARGATSS